MNPYKRQTTQTTSTEGPQKQLDETLADYTQDTDDGKRYVLYSRDDPDEWVSARLEATIDTKVRR